MSLVGFGLDSGIESAASILVGLRLATRLKHGEADEDREAACAQSGRGDLLRPGPAAYVVFEGVGR